LVRDAQSRIDGAFFRAQVDRAIALRSSLDLPSEETTGYRLIHAEGDGLPGLIVDRFGDLLVVQFLTLGMKLHEGLVLEALAERLRPRAILDRSPVGSAKSEGFTPDAGVVRGEAVKALAFRERGLQFSVPLEVAQKTGYYFDQRPARARIESLARGRRVLDAYCFVGSFALGAARGGAADVLAVDESALALEIAADSAQANGLGEKIRFVRHDARRVLVDAGATGGYDLVVVDPPRLAPTRAARDGAIVAYSKLAELACRATTPGGKLLFCSCSAAVDLAALTRALATGARRANVEAVVLERWFQGPDHPVHSAFGEGLYLKSLLARISPR
jgi:23S rRNA (cytosine1962-C5)-methyltransferase